MFFHAIPPAAALSLLAWHLDHLPDLRLGAPRKQAGVLKRNEIPDARFVTRPLIDDGVFLRELLLIVDKRGGEGAFREVVDAVMGNN